MELNFGMRTTILVLALLLATPFGVKFLEAEQREEKTLNKPEGLNRYSRPEDRGPGFSGFGTLEILRILKDSEDKIELRKAAKELGDRNIAGKVQFTSENMEAIEIVVSGWLQQAKSKDADTRVEASQQIERLWHLAVPVLLEGIDDSEPTVAELAIKSLILMRNEAVVKALVEKAEYSEDEHTRKMAIFTLIKMREQRESVIPGRTCLDEEKSEILYRDLVIPALDRLANE